MPALAFGFSLTIIGDDHDHVIVRGADRDPGRGQGLGFGLLLPIVRNKHTVLIARRFLQFPRKLADADRVPQTESSATGAGDSPQQ